MASGNQLAVKSIDVLFTWLWEWRDGRYERKGWSEKPYRLLYRKSYEIIASIQGKDAAREWKKDLRASFLQSHWLLPYPQKHSFMRKSKATGQVMWWSSVHQGLHDYYDRLAAYGSLPQTIPASYIKHHPSNYWGRSQPGLEYMDFTVQPEQHLVQLSETDMYRELLHLQSQFNEPTRRPGNREQNPHPVVYDIVDIIEDPQRSRAPMHCWDVGTCSIKMHKALENYQVLQHHRYNRRRLRRRNRRPNNDSDT